MNLNRIAAITWPTRLHSILSIKVTTFVIGGIVLFAGSVCSWNLFFFEVEDFSVEKYNKTMPHCKSSHSVNQKGGLALVIGWVQPAIPLLIVLAVGLVLGARLIQLFCRRKSLISKTSVQRPQLDTLLSNTNNDSASQGATCKNQIDRKKASDQPLEKYLPKEIRIAAAIMTMTLIYVLIEGAILILQGHLILKAYFKNSDVWEMEEEDEEEYEIINENRLTESLVEYNIKTFKYRLQNISILLRQWNFYAYLLLMPSFRESVCDGLKLLFCKK